jgi:hypothetical protein
MLKQAEVEAFGPILLGMAHAIHVLQATQRGRGDR